MTAFSAAYEGYMSQFDAKEFDGMVAVVPVKTCTCCGKIFSIAVWTELPLMAIVEVDEGVSMEMKNCDVCHSTLMWMEREGK